MANKQIDVPALIDGARLGAFQVLAITLCGLALLMDGFDIQMIGFVAPAIVQDWNIDKAALGPVFAAGLGGLLVGSFALSVAADKWGRRPVLIASTLFFGVCMLLTPLATTLAGLGAARFFAGLGLGAILPNAMALAGEYAPQRVRVTVLMLVGVCFGVGAILAGLLSTVLLPRWGWQSVFLAGGVVPVACAVAMFVRLPESIQFLVLRGRHAAARKWLRRIDAAAVADEQAELKVKEPAPGGAPVFDLFAGGRARMTLLLWGVNLLNLLTVYFLANWIPTVVRGAGRPLGDAVLAGTALQAGGTFGALVLGVVIDRVGFRRVLLACFMLAAVAVFSVGRLDMAGSQLFIAVSVAGFCVIGGQGAVNALSTSYYPTALRSTGIGWALGIGRFGSILGPLLGGEFLKMGLPTSSIFLVLAVPPVVCSLLVWAMEPGRRAPAVPAANAA
ncbi:MFS transporter [Ramlibacter sp. G-1-2-2]|uniref:MFS transporter n=1 Tax=Ramlibacter agri TaxID=2728837 RepID=A0A848H3M6_9BURK|nr:MFS transporter [Ramlibacter agri]NML44161.1 MFS transporter [Ramlibacter agri]